MSNWQQELSNGFENVADLLDFLEIDKAHGALEAQKKFKTKLPRGFAAKMQKKNLHDPLLLQVLASSAELLEKNNYQLDPLQESQFNPVPGLIHKYPHRALLVLSGACAIHCRYCFRRHFPYQDNNPGTKGWSLIKDYFLQHPEINELIFSGGDPLILTNEYFFKFLSLMKDVSSLKTIRIHSRIPIVLPTRIDAQWLTMWEAFPWKKLMVVHTNHAQELDEDVVSAMKLLKQKDWFLLNQSVLLKNINDRAEVLAQLSYRLFDAGVMPYYLHLLDKVQGASHFEIERDIVKQIYAELQTLLPGYLLPKLVEEVPGKSHKTLLI